MSVEQEYTQVMAAMMRGDYPTAAQEFEEILRKDPKVSFAWNNRGLCLLNLGHPFDATLNIDKAIEVNPTEASYYNNKGACHFEQLETEKALAAYTKAVELVPDFPEPWNNIGNVKKWNGDIEGAIKAYRNAIAGRPDYSDAHLHLAFTLLLHGEYIEGWKEFEWRWKTNQMPSRGLKTPTWNGEPLDGKTLLIYSEQGFGDALQFIRYAPLVKAKYGGTVLVEVKQPLTRLSKTVEGIDGIITLGDKLPEIDYIIPMMSLPRILGTTVETIPNTVPYFKVDKDKTDSWDATLDKLPPGVRVGICWAGMSRPGSPEADNVDKRRSTTLNAFAPVALVPGVSWVSLQKGPPTTQVNTPPKGMTIGDFTEDMFDFYDTASIIEKLDLVITVDTAVVHLAAALGKPTWVLSRWDGCWRWLGNRSDSPWYPTVKQFVQSSPGDWGSVMAEVSVALRQFVKERNSKPA